MNAKMKHMIRRFSCIIILLFTAGCAVGNSHQFSTITAPLGMSGGGKIVNLGVLDRRLYVLSGNKNSDFVGLQRGGFGNPFDVTTVSGRPFAEEIASAIGNSLRSSGFVVNTVNLNQGISPPDAVRMVANGSTQKNILLTLKELKSDTMVDIRFIYDVELDVFDKNGKPITKVIQQGTDNLDGSFWNAPARARRVVPEGLKALITKLFSDPRVVHTLSRP